MTSAKRFEAMRKAEHEARLAEAGNRILDWLIKGVFLGAAVAIAVALLTGCTTTTDWRDKVSEFEKYLDDWDKLSIEEIWDSLRGKEAVKDDRGWYTGAATFEPHGKPKNWKWTLTTRGIDATRDKEKEEAEQSLFLVKLTNGKIYPFVMHGGRNCMRIRAKGGEAFNVSCGDSIGSPIPTDSAEWTASVSNGVFDITLNGVPLGRKDRDRGIRKHYLPIDVGDGKLECIIVSQWPDRMLKSAWKAGEIEQ